MARRFVYGVREIRNEYLVFLAGAIFLGVCVVWAEFPHGLGCAVWMGGLTTVLAAACATIGFIRRSSSFRCYQFKHESEKAKRLYVKGVIEKNWKSLWKKTTNLWKET